MNNSNRICRECAEPFMGLKRHAAFCSTGCRKAWNNRRATRGALMYDAVMSMRFDRAAAKEAGVDWTMVCRLAEMFNNEDKVAGPHGKSFRRAAEIVEEHGCEINARRCGRV